MGCGLQGFISDFEIVPRHLPDLHADPAHDEFASLMQSRETDTQARRQCQNSA